MQTRSGSAPARQHGSSQWMLNIARRPAWFVCRSRAVVKSTFSTMPKEKRAGQPRSVHFSSHIRILNVDNATAAPSVLLFFDKDRYLFNAGEGIQRHFIEHKQRLKKVTHVLATRVHTDTLAGLPGMLLSQVEPGQEYGKGGAAAVTASVTGPAGLQQYVDAFRQYASAFALNVTELGKGKDGKIVSEGRVTITPLLITPTPSSSTKPEPAAAAATNGADAAAEEADGAAEPAAKKPRHDTPAHPDPAAAAAAAASGSGARGIASVSSSAGVQQPVACYVCQLATIAGKFDPQKAAQLGVARGPLFGELQRGKSVTAINGRTVHPHEVMASPTMPGPCLIIVDCPSLDYLPALQSNPTLLQLQQEAAQQQLPTPQADGAAAGDGPAAAAAAGASTNGTGSSGDAGEGQPRKRFVLVHTGPAEVSRSAEYAAWCAGFGAAADQLFASSDSQRCTTTRRAAQLQAQLSLVEPDVFSLQGFAALKQQHEEASSSQQGAGTATSAAGAGAGAVAAAAAGSQSVSMDAADGVVFRLVPARMQGLCMQTAVTQPPDLEAVQAEVRSQHPRVMQLLQQYAAAKQAVLQQQQEQPDPQLQGITRETCALTPLGTCSACPSNHRNVSSYYLDLFDKGGLLMDCGEDSMGQLERRFGRAEAERGILQLHAVWVSHMHADHHGGLYPLLLRRQALLQQQHDSQPGSDTADGREQATASAGGSAPAGVKPLLILGPFPLFRVLCQYSKILPLSFTFLPNHYFFSPSARPPPAEALAAYEAVKAAAGLSVLEPFPVQHVSNSSGLQVQSQSGWKAVFSGDTRPCQAVIDAAKDATLLVHEATFEDELQSEAIAKKHSTTAEALGVAAAAGAYRTLLTHFSTRYPKIPVMKPPADAPAVEGAEGVDGAGSSGGGSDLAAVGSVLVAFDMMTLNFADLAWLPQMLPVLDELFKEEEAAYMDDDEGGEGGVEAE